MTLAAVAVALCLATQAPSDQMLLMFSSSGCAECQSMEPVLRRLAADGVRVERIDVAAQRDLVQRFQVTRVPSFVMWSGGKPTGRVEGAASYDRLLQMVAAAAQPPTDRLASPPPPPLQPTMPLATPPATVRGQSPDAATTAVDPSTVDPRAAAERALRATVRLRVEDATGASIGTGTIIDVHDDEALVVTCGHIFRELKRGGRIWIDMFLPGATQAVEGQLLDFDLQRDIGVVAMRPGLAVQAARVGSLTYRPAKGEPVFSIGCDRGAPPSIRPSRVTAIDRYQGKPNIEVAGKPVDGRSGGGLFTADGQLIGVCNAADDKDDEGIYAGLATIQWQLESIGQRRLFAGQTPVATPSPTPPAASPAATPIVPTLANIPSAAPLANRVAAPAAPAATADSDLEVICVLRSKQAANRQETLLISRPTAELLQRLYHEAQAPSPKNQNR